MKKTMLIILGVILFAFIAVALAGMYKFNYLANQEGYDVDGNKIQPIETMPEEVEEAKADYIGLNIEAAEALAAQNKVPFRIVERDGQPLPVTMDYRPGRINATVNNDQVISYTVE